SPRFGILISNWNRCLIRFRPRCAYEAWSRSLEFQGSQSRIQEEGDVLAGSPFPGMNPYLEAPGVWESFHHTLIVYTAAALNRALPPDYVAVVEEWLRVIPNRQSIRPDVVIGDAPAPVSGGTVATLERSTVSGDAPFIVEA